MAPWSIHDNKGRRFEIHFGTYGECVAEVVHTEADARLIAAAPDLLAACEELVSMGEPEDEIAARILAKAEAAIAKAKGAK
jgi:hypothetical protein